MAAKCTCKMCVRIDRCREVVAKLSPEDAQFIWDLVGELEGVSMDLNWHQAIADGSWPNAEEILRGWLAQTTKPAEAGSEGQGA